MLFNPGRFFFLVLASLAGFFSVAQESSKVEILGASNLEYIKSGAQNISKLSGNVRLKQNNTYMDCDSALFYETENQIEAFSNVRINHNDSVTITGDYLFYDGNTKKALIKGKAVTMVDKNMTLTTTQLDYDLANQFGYYAAGGTIVSKETRLVSDFGYYYARTNEFFFKRNVVLSNPDYTMTSDTLMYNTLTKVSYFYGPTRIHSKTDQIYCENGWYNTSKDQSQFSRNAVLFSDRKMLKADSLFYDRKNQVGKAFRNIHVYDSAQKIHLFGNSGITNGKSRITWVSGNCLAIRIMEKGDSLLLFSDTLILTQRRQGQKEVLKAFRNVKIFKSDIQAVCDSLVYLKDDSTLWMYKSPVMWSGENQLFSDTICFFINNGRLDSFNLINNAMIISREKGAHFNQIRGKNMKAELDTSSLKFVEVFGNGQSIYYAKEDSINYVGVNVIDCSIMNFKFDHGKLQKAVFITAPDATLYPVEGLKPEEFRLKGFKWFDNRRPQRVLYQFKN